MPIYEVEMKFPIEDFQRLLPLLEKLNAKSGEDLHQTDTYFAHPQRDFATTNEAFRIRSSGSENRITYKGPLIDTETKTREEIELTLQSGADSAAQLSTLLQHLSFRPVRSVAKVRTPYHFQWQGLNVELTWDRIAGLGEYVEIEAVANEESLEITRQSILELAAHLKLENQERRSYLVLLIEQEENADN